MSDDALDKIFLALNTEEKAHLMNRHLKSKEHYTAKDLIRLLNITDYTVRRHLRAGIIKGVKPGKSWLIPYSEYRMIELDPDIIRKRRKLAELEKLDDERQA